jgi:ABC-type multidrug transport system ATPase subunit
MPKDESIEEDLSTLDPLAGGQPHQGTNGAEDRDVAAERAAIEKGAVSTENRSIVIRNLRKVYCTGKTEKVALNSVSLTMERDKCFALLGPNGAGKTTALSILCGLFPPTSGSGFVEGYNVRTERSKIHLSLGVCPQHDILWDDLTAEEHFLFYARLKGVRPSEEKAHVASVLDKVGLNNEAGHRPSKSLSGGMKRRLSIAIALVGDPRVMFFG